MQERQCGTCGQCCKVFPIPEVDKPRGDVCRNFDLACGCRIYPQRPYVCKAFECYWKLDKTLGAEWKPDLCGMVIKVDRIGKRFCVQVTADPDWAEPWAVEPFVSQIRRWASAAPPTERYVVVVAAENTWVVLPDRMVELGSVADDQEYKLDFWQENGRWELSFAPSP